ncbi:hypothetical protein HB825_03510 [Listeria booriae]|uniref:hypothetical protein n=1 Tax=Listeria booriae TaxID=1552123 RepID=UPI0016273DD7|nr:hypothetical protein [Listeria booriae]MBC1919398.1 hypothetical protein [Listeria booriae]MBC6133898.1 hypothetical protein [Listeria booriae]
MAVNVMKAVQKTMGGTKMTHRMILENDNTVYNYICCKNGKLLDENGEVMQDTQTYINRGMKAGWEPYREEK